MVKHVVMWDIQENVTIEDLERLKSRIEEIGREIPEVVSLVYNINPYPSSSARVTLESIHNSYEDLQTYINHPLHKEFGYTNRMYVTTRKSFDYEY